jgi:UDP-N-acetylmuramoyl-tripeptide--D-alanyl-D-alanine ligase
MPEGKAMFTLVDVLIAAGAEEAVDRLDAHLASVTFDGAAIDSRLVSPGDLFVALVGERHDGHDYVDAAFEHGATAALVQRASLAALQLSPDRTIRVLGNGNEDTTDGTASGTKLLIATDDPLAALHRLATNHRAKFDLDVIGISGSVGKTSTKEATAAVLEQHFNTLKTPRSYNSESTMPLTILQLDKQHQAAVIEMGTYGPGEIAQLAAIARPRIGIVTNVGISHMERMLTIETIAQAEGELIDALPDDGVAILNYDDDLVRAMTARTKARPFFFGLSSEADVWADQIESHGFEGVTLRAHHRGDTVELSIPLMGKHHAYTALAAASAGLVLGMRWDEIAAGLKTCGERLRFITVAGPNGSIILDDTYNASPVSCVAALDLLAELEGRHIAIFGDMFELGPVEEEAHRTVGRHAATTVDLLYTVGERARWIADEARRSGQNLEIVELGDKPSAVELLAGKLRRGDHVLVKGARGMEMETVVAGLHAAAGSQTR